MPGFTPDLPGPLGINMVGYASSVDIAKSNSEFGVVGASAPVELAHPTYQAAGFLGGADPTFHQFAGAYGQSAEQGVMGLTTANNGTGVYGGGTMPALQGVIGVRGETTSGVGVQGRSFGPGLAGKFIGNVEIDGNITVSGDVLLANADCAEDFDVAESTMEPGTVVVLDESGCLKGCCEGYDKRVAGVISGAGAFRPGIILDKQHSDRPRMPVALFGKVFCKVDANHSPIAVGDALTTSATPGHAMKAIDRGQAFGAVIGKALGRLESGRGLIPMLIALQ